MSAVPPAGGAEPRRSRRRWTSVLLWIGLAAAAFLVWHDHATRLRLRAPEESSEATPLELVDLEGRTVRLEDYRGRVVLLNVWASWCGPCRREVPVLVDLHRRRAGEGLVVLGLNVDGMEAGDLRRVVEDWRIAYPVVLPAGTMRGTFEKPEAIPHTWMIDRAGRIRASHTGLASATSLERACGLLLEEPAAEGG